jgi:hypothetical protein
MLVIRHGPPVDRCLGGHFAEAYEQNTQQSPGLGLSVAWHAVHS